jgi:hypothetical protein
MPLLDTVTKNYEAHADSVSVVRKFLPSARTVATGIGLGRVAIGAAFLAAPTVSVRILGVSNATAKRMAFLARMTAARDIALGSGTLHAGTGRRAVPWLLAGAGADVVDAVAIAGAMKGGVAGGAPAVGTVAGAAAAAAIGVWAALELSTLD